MNTENSRRYSPDEVAVAVCVYGVHLEPEEVSALLCGPPTHGHRKGERKGLRSPAFDKGAWIREVRRFEPIDLDSMFDELLLPLTEDASVWAELLSRFEVRISISAHTDVGLTLYLNSTTLQRIAARCANVQVCIQAYGDNEA